jgi:thioredoxin reductase (NADPH)
MTEKIKELVDLDERGYVIAGEDCKTSMPGVFVAGDCRTKEIRQLVTAAADGAVAATEACRYLG